MILKKNNEENALLRQSLSYTLPDEDKHHPDCSSITDHELVRSIQGTWPTKNGVAKIPYSFSRVGFWGHPLITLRYLKFIPQDLDNPLGNDVRDFIKDSLQSWSLASNNSIQFYETNPTLFSRGIFFFLAGSEDYLSKTQDAYAFAMRAYNNNHQISSAYVFLPNDKDAWNKRKLDAFSLTAWSHEIGHALGFNHLHEISSTQLKLQNINDGVYCSVMPYYHEIESFHSKCQQNCHPHHSIHPGSLDARMMKLAYLNGMTSGLSTYNLTMNYAANFADTMLLSSLMALIYQSLQTYFAALSFYESYPVFSKKMASFLADSLMLATSYFLEFSPLALGLFAATAATKYIPDPLLNQLPEDVKNGLTSDYCIYILNLVRAIELGQKPLPLIITVSLSLLSTDVVQYKSLGLLLAWLSNQIPQAITSRYCHEAKEITSQEALTEISTQSVSYEEIEPLNISYRAIIENKPTSLAKRLCTWFHRKDSTQRVEEPLESRRHIHPN